MVFSPTRSKAPTVTLLRALVLCTGVARSESSVKPGSTQALIALLAPCEDRRGL